MERCTRKSAGAEACPVCGQVGRQVSDATIRAMLDPAHLERLLPLERRFCRTPSCDVLYYGPDGRSVRKQDAGVRVGLKETEDPIPLCYCFGFSRADVEREHAEAGSCTIPARIATEIRAGHCACEVKNPSGACCLGDVRAAVAEVTARASPPRLRKRLAADGG
jgi:Zinc binding domain